MTKQQKAVRTYKTESLRNPIFMFYNGCNNRILQLTSFSTFVRASSRNLRNLSNSLLSDYVCVNTVFNIKMLQKIKSDEKAGLLKYKNISYILSLPVA